MKIEQKKPVFWLKAKKDLCKKDNKLAKIIKRYPGNYLYSRSDPFYTLARSIVGQQISVKAAQSIWNKLIFRCPKMTPKNHFEYRSDHFRHFGSAQFCINFVSIFV